MNSRVYFNQLVILVTRTKTLRRSTWQSSTCFLTRRTSSSVLTKLMARRASMSSRRSFEPNWRQWMAITSPTDQGLLTHHTLTEPKCLNGLCNGFRLIVRQFLARGIEAGVEVEIKLDMCALFHGSHCFPHNPGLPYDIRRKQFPAHLAHAMTIYKSHRHTIQRIGISLAKYVFLHRQLHVVFSRATASQKLSVLLDAESTMRRLMRNVVYSEALR